MHDCSSLYTTFVNVKRSIRTPYTAPQHETSQRGCREWAQSKLDLFIMFVQRLWTLKCHGRAAPYPTMCSDSFFEGMHAACKASKQASTQNFIYIQHFFVKGNAVWASNKVKKTRVYTNSRCVWVYGCVCTKEGCVKDTLPAWEIGPLTSNLFF